MLVFEIKTCYFLFQNRHGKADYADALVAVWDGESRGTEHMIDYMRTLKKPVYVYIFRE